MLLDSVFSMQDMVLHVDIIAVEVAVVMIFEPAALLLQDACCSTSKFSVIMTSFGVR